MSEAPHLSRRQFMKAGVLAGSGLIVAFSLPSARRAAMANEAAGAATSGFMPNAFLRISADDSVTVLLAHSEMGQGIWTGLSMLIAEELDADWSKIRIEHAPADPAYKRVGSTRQMTGGSSSTRTEFDRYRQAGAAARVLLLQAASLRLNVPLSELRTERGSVVHGDRRIRYGELADEAGKLPVPDAESLVLKDRKDWVYVGKPMLRLDSAQKITGQAVYGMDIQFEGLLTAVVARSPVFGGTVVSFDASDAKAVAGVRHVVQVPSGVAVVADHYWAAKMGRDALRIEWAPGPYPDLDSDAQRSEFRRLASTPGALVAEAGDPIAELGKSERVVEAEYAVPYLAHAPMEPLNCTVKLTPGRCELWTGTQYQTADQNAAAAILGLEPEQVFINTPFLGGGFGRRASTTSDFVSEAVWVAKTVQAPVKTVWSREDDIRGGYYRSAFLQRARIAIDEAGMPVAWHHVIVGQSIATGTMLEPLMVHDGVDGTSVEGVADAPYMASVPHYKVELHSPKTGVPVLWWRSVGHSHTGFVIEGLIDELAHAAERDPVEYRRALLQEHPRHLRVLNLAAEKFGWKTHATPGRGRGIAVHESFGSFVAQAAEVSLENGAIKVHRVVCAIDCGPVVNPSGVRAQMESGIVFGLSAALHSQLTFRNGQVQQSNFHDYSVLRINETPEIEVHIVDSDDPIGGVGEPGTPPIAPAVANALFALTGERARELPLRLSRAASDA